MTLPAPQSADDQLRATLIGCCALLFWACSLAFAKRCSEDLGPLTTAAIQHLVSGALGLLLLGRSGRPAPSALFRNPRFFARAGLFALYLALIYWAVGAVARDHLPAVTLFNYLWPTLTLLLSIAMMRLPFNPLMLAVGSCAVMLGIATELDTLQAGSLLGGVPLLPCLAAGAGAAVWGFYSVLLRLWKESAGGDAALPWVLLVASAALFVLRTAAGEESRVTSGTLAPLLYLSLAPLAANFCWQVGMRRGDVTALSLCADTLPWLSLMVSQLSLGIAIAPGSWAAAGLMITGALLSRCALRAAASPLEAARLKTSIVRT